MLQALAARAIRWPTGLMLFVVVPSVGDIIWVITGGYDRPPVFPCDLGRSGGKVVAGSVGWLQRCWDNLFPEFIDVLANITDVLMRGR